MSETIFSGVGVRGYDGGTWLPDTDPGSPFYLTTYYLDKIDVNGSEPTEAGPAQQPEPAQEGEQ